MLPRNLRTGTELVRGVSCSLVQFKEPFDRSGSSKPNQNKLMFVNKMTKDYFTWTYPDIPDELASQFAADKDDALVVVGVIGRSKCAQANKMCAFGMQPKLEHRPAEGQIQCYYKPGTSMLLLHFETPYDEAVLGQLLDAAMEQGAAFDFDDFYEQMRSRFVRMLLLALHVCHIVVYVETSPIFDVNLVSICQLLKYVREQHVLQFLPSVLPRSSAAWLGDSARLCTPRLLFLFENYPADEEKTRDCISAHEFQTEDNIYELLRHCGIIEVSSSANSLLALPNNKQFVFFNAHEQLRPDTLLRAISELKSAMLKSDLKEEDDDLEIIDLAPFAGFVKPFGPAFKNRAEAEDDPQQQLYRMEHTVWQFLRRHVQDALRGCFDEGCFKQPAGRSTHFQLLNGKQWLELMDDVHRVLVKNALDADFETNNEEYRLYLQHFDDSLNYERSFWSHLCEVGLKQGVTAYKNAAPASYGSEMHAQLLADASVAFEEEGRGPPKAAALQKLAEICQRHWQEGRQQCELLSLRGQPCIQPKDVPHEKHGSILVHISSCNCGRTQGRREDPYALRQANYEYYEQLGNLCNLCAKVKQFKFPIFEPSISDYRAAAFEAAFPLLRDRDRIRSTQDTTQQQEDGEEEDDEEDVLPFSQPAESAVEQSLSHGCSQPLSPTYDSDLDLSMPSSFGGTLETQAAPNVAATFESPYMVTSSDRSSSSTDSSSSSDSAEEQPQKELEQLEVSMLRQASTTEYLPGLVHEVSPAGLLPLFPSWSLACVGPSSIYSHSTGLQEHFQSGFLSGANFLLPWDVQVRLHKPKAVADIGGKKAQRFRKHGGGRGDRVSLKIFIGFEYECSRGHRFMMSGPDRVLRGGADIERDTSSQVVDNNMPLYYACPCRSQSPTSPPQVAQLMRIHVVTPKAPVNVILNPKVRVEHQTRGSKSSYTFTLGCFPLPRLSQSAYWILRLPFVYQGDDVLIPPPKEPPAAGALAQNCLLAGMIFVVEAEGEDYEE